MATFDIVGFEDVEKELMRLSEHATKAIPKMLEAGAEILVRAQKQEAAAIGQNGGLAASITASKVQTGKEDEKYINVYPKGKTDHGSTQKGKKDIVGWAQVGFTLNYGRANMAARPWMTAANEKSKDAVHAAMREIWEGGQ